MASISLLDQLDQAIDVLVTDSASAPPHADPVIHELLSIARDLCHLPSPGFKARLKADLLEQAYLRPTAPARAYPAIPGLVVGKKTAEGMAIASKAASDILPTLAAGGYRGFPAQRANFAASFL